MSLPSMPSGFVRLLQGAWSATSARRYLHATIGQFRSTSGSEARRRLLILVAATMVCAYAIGVFGHVVVMPDLGLRFGFGCYVNHVYPGFLETPHSEAAPDLVGTRIEKIGQQPVRNLPELLRATIDLEKVSARTVSDLLALKPEDNLVLVNGERLVRIEYRGAEDNLPHAVWCKVGTPPRESLAPAVIWLCIKMGLFAVGFLVFWKRPTDRSAALFFLLCTVTFGAYIGGYHWWQILTRPTLLLVFMVCSVLLPAVSLHFYLV